MGLQNNYVQKSREGNAETGWDTALQCYLIVIRAPGACNALTSLGLEGEKLNGVGHRVRPQRYQGE